MSITLNRVSRTTGYISHPKAQISDSVVRDAERFKVIIGKIPDPREKLAVILLSLPTLHLSPIAKGAAGNHILDKLTMFFSNYSEDKFFRLGINYVAEILEGNKSEKWAGLVALPCFPFECLKNNPSILEDKNVQESVKAIKKRIRSTIIADTDSYNVQAAARALEAMKIAYTPEEKADIKTISISIRDIFKKNALPADSERSDDFKIAIQALDQLIKNL